jgi:hypothetical protein
MTRLITIIEVRHIITNTCKSNQLSNINSMWFDLARGYSREAAFVVMKSGLSLSKAEQISLMIWNINVKGMCISCLWDIIWILKTVNDQDFNCSRCVSCPHTFIINYLEQKSCHYYDWKNEFMAHFKDIDHLGDVMDSVLRSWIRGPVGSIIKFGASLGLWIMCPSGAIS